MDGQRVQGVAMSCDGQGRGEDTVQSERAERGAGAAMRSRDRQSLVHRRAMGSTLELWEG